MKAIYGQSGSERELQAMVCADQANTTPVGVARHAVDPQKIINSPRFPTLPAVALRLVELLGDPDVKINEVGSLIKTDPALSLLMLKTANSPVYSPRREIASIENALVLLGQSTVMTLALGFTLVDSAKTADCGPALDRYWLRSIIHAAAAELLGGRYKTRQCSELFLCGLLADIGRLGILKVVPDAYTAVVAIENQINDLATIDDWKSLPQIETELMGIDHVELGSQILEKWRLPELTRLAISRHHAPLDELKKLRSSEQDELTRAVSVSSVVADYFMNPNSPAISQLAWKYGNELFGFTEQDWKVYLNEVHQRSQQIGEMLNVETSGLVDPVEIIALANCQLVELSVRSQALAAEAFTRCDSMRKVQTDLEHENLTLKRRVVRDALTHVYNRAFFEEYVEKELDRCRRIGSGVAIVFCDIDSFKALNDSYGHPFGDQVLRAVAQSIQTAVRSSDIVGRYGGEEFVVLVVNSHVYALAEICERIREAAAAVVLRYNEIPVSVTLSVGATFAADVGVEPTCDALIARADTAMYEAKRAGGNRVYIHDGNRIVYQQPANT